MMEMLLKAAEDCTPLVVQLTNLIIRLGRAGLNRKLLNLVAHFANIERLKQFPYYPHQLLYLLQILLRLQSFCTLSESNLL